MKNYRKFYEDKTGVKIPKCFDIHHIDQNRKNNDIDNLVALPKNIHSHYHDLTNQLSHIHIQTQVPMLWQSGLPHCYKILSDKLSKYSEVMDRCHSYIVYRDFLLKRIPHNYKGAEYYEI